jgi:hypothetical protein
MERRTSPRTKTNFAATIRNGSRQLEGRCVELSQTGMLVSLPRRAIEACGAIAAVTLELPGGTTRVLAKPIGFRKRSLALAILALSDGDQERITDYLFDRMLTDALKVKRRVARKARRAAA